MTQEEFVPVTPNNRQQVSQRRADARKKFKDDRSKDKSYISFQDGETKDITFNPDVAPLRKDSDQYPGRFGYIYEVTEDAVDPHAVKQLRFSPTWADLVEAELDKGYSVLRITRHGADKKTTRYEIKGIR
jgi:hypothetical protein